MLQITRGSTAVFPRFFLTPHQASQIKNVLAVGAVSGSKRLAHMADKTKTSLQQTEAQVSLEKGSEKAMVQRCPSLSRLSPKGVYRDIFAAG